MPWQQIPKSRTMRELFDIMPPSSYKQIVRMDKDTFERIIRLIKDNPVFHSESNIQQQPVWFQCMVVFERLGCDGNGASVGRFGRHYGISAGAVCAYTDRVFKALLGILWLQAEE
jgi:hypothetical protein